MIDYTAAGFTLLQGAHLYAPEDRGICDVLVANGKIIAVASKSLLTLYRTARLSISVGRSSAQVLLINTSI
ncbi:isoaspartyl dipeptidase [Escherichia coli J96]|nr:isoaspartyl dipeptidase [Escherichia coli J96]